MSDELNDGFAAGHAKGAEAMRERCARECEEDAEAFEHVAEQVHGGLKSSAGSAASALRTAASSIRALDLEE